MGEHSVTSSATTLSTGRGYTVPGRRHHDKTGKAQLSRSKGRRHDSPGVRPDDAHPSNPVRAHQTLEER
jgi:hypothetical protein